MERLVHPTPVKTRIIRTPAAGPPPANTLVYLDCRVAGTLAVGDLGRSSRAELEFRTEFKLDGYQQQLHDWYLENTLVSATAMLRFLNTTTDVIFTFSVDRIEPLLALDGTLGFICEQAIYLDDEAILFGPSRIELVMSASVGAYVLCYEPLAEAPPSGGQHGIWSNVASAPTALSWTRARRFAAADANEFRMRSPTDARPRHERRQADRSDSCDGDG